MHSEPPVLDDASIALIQSSHAAKVLAVADRHRRATATYAYTCRVDAASGRVLAAIERGQAAPVLAALETGGRVTLVACDIETFRSLQVKGDGARVVALGPAEREDVAAHCREFARFSAEVGYDPAVTLAHMGCRADDAVCIEFTLRQGFVQTPGPTAGQPLPPP